MTSRNALVERLRDKRQPTYFGTAECGSVSDKDCQEAADAIEALTREVDKLRRQLQAAAQLGTEAATAISEVANQRDALQARLAALTTAEGCDARTAWVAFCEAAVGPSRSNLDCMSAALAAGCAPLGARYEAVVKAARALKFGAYPAHGSGFVIQVTDGNINDLANALAALDQGGDA